jgi:ATP-binding cassette, subfamily F, member 3
MDSVRIVSIDRRSMSFTATFLSPFQGSAGPNLSRGGLSRIARHGTACDHGGMAVVIASNLRKELSGDPLFDRVSFKVERGDRVALSGPNGAGKTTLLRMLVGETGTDGGELAFEKGTRIALHDQRPPFQRVLTLREYVLTGAADLVALERELSELETAMAAGRHDDATLSAYSHAQARLEHAGGYRWRDRAGTALHGLGFSHADLDRRLETFSGGELTRASLARALAGDPDLLLLDEPTNHLDIASLEWLEKELTSLDAAIVLVAHDRWFLEAVATATMELEAGQSTYFAGPWHAWRREKAERMGHAQKNAARLSVDIARLERFVERFRYKKTKAKQAQAKLTQIQRLEKERAEARGEVALLSRRTKTLGFEFLDPPRSGRTVVEVRGLSLAAGDKQLVDGVSFAVERGEHVALVGPNGSGKTTLLEVLLGRREPAAGSARLGHGVAPAYFSQHALDLDERGSVLDCVQIMTGLTRPKAQKLLGQFLFSGWDAHEKAVTALSGGERRRLALAVLVASGANFLVLDEPTNHLDLESREALEAALEAFPGTVLLVSHDRALLDAVAERTAAIEDGTVRLYEGGWADYVRRRDEIAAAATEAAKAAAPAPAAPRREKPKREPPLRPRSRDPVAEIEARIEAQEALVGKLEAKLAEDWSDVDTIAAHRRAREELQALIGDWEQLVDEVVR